MCVCFAVLCELLLLLLLPWWLLLSSLTFIVVPTILLRFSMTMMIIVICISSISKADIVMSVDVEVEAGGGIKFDYLTICRVWVV